jgi:hypothetical protein
MAKSWCIINKQGKAISLLCEFVVNFGVNAT